MKIYYFRYSNGQESTGFFKWCLEHKLYKENTRQLFNIFTSRMKLVYDEFLKPNNGISAIVITANNNIPIAIALCELNDNQKLIGYNCLGYLNLYVKKNYRNQKLATILVQEIERFSLKFEKEKNNCYFECSKVTYDIIDKKCQYVNAYTQINKEEYMTYNKLYDFLDEDYLYNINLFPKKNKLIIK